MSKAKVVEIEEELERLRRRRRKLQRLVMALERYVTSEGGAIPTARDVARRFGLAA